MSRVPNNVAIEYNNASVVQSQNAKANMPPALQALVSQLNDTSWDSDRGSLINDIFKVASKYNGDKVALLFDVYESIESSRCRERFLLLLETDSTGTLSKSEHTELKTRIKQRNAQRVLARQTSPINQPPAGVKVIPMRQKFWYMIDALNPNKHNFVKERNCRNGQKIISKGEKSQKIYFIGQGSVTVGLPDGSVRILRSGDVIGEIGWLIDIPRTADVIASEGTVLFEIDSESKGFRNWIVNNKEGKRA